MHVWVKDDSAIVSCLFHEKELIKAIGDCRFNRELKVWIFPKRKLIDIIDNIKINYDSDTEKIYHQLRDERHEFHNKIILANKIKANKFEFARDEYKRLYTHQKQAVELGLLFGSYALFMSTGTGKTATAITLMAILKKPAMVISPLSTLESVWMHEIPKWSSLKAINLWKNNKAIKYNADVFVINYEQFKIMSAKNRKEIEEKIKILIIDESGKMKNSRSEITKTILSYRHTIPHRFCLTGTPAPNNLLEYWGQVAFINDELLFDNFYKFRNTFFRSGGYGGFQYYPKSGAKEAIIDRISRQAFSIKKEDCIELPERVFMERIIDMDERQNIAYQEMKELNILEFADQTILSANELAKIMKLRQVTAGFVINNDGVPVLISDTKMNVLKDIIDEIPEDESVIVWCQFHYEIERIYHEYKDTAVTLYGQMSNKEKQEAIQDFSDKKKRLLIAHPKTGGLGLNFQKVCSYMVWYSLSYSQEEYSQANDRIYRSGQVNKCTYFLLLARKTIDEIIYKALMQKANLMESCMELLKKGE